MVKTLKFRFGIQLLKTQNFYIKKHFPSKSYFDRKIYVFRLNWRYFVTCIYLILGSYSCHWSGKLHLKESRARPSRLPSRCLVFDGGAPPPLWEQWSLQGFNIEQLEVSAAGWVQASWWSRIPVLQVNLQYLIWNKGSIHYSSK